MVNNLTGVISIPAMSVYYLNIVAKWSQNQQIAVRVRFLEQMETLIIKWVFAYKLQVRLEAIVLSHALYLNYVYVL